MVKEADVLVPTVTDRIDADLIAAAGDQLKLIASFERAWTISTLPPPRRAASPANTPGPDRGYGRRRDGADAGRAAAHRRGRQGNEDRRMDRPPTGMLGH